MIELLRTFESDGHYFAVVGVVENGVTKKFRFGIHESGYAALRKIFQTRPFDAMPGINYRYFLWTYGQNSITVRIES